MIPKPKKKPTQTGEQKTYSELVMDAYDQLAEEEEIEFIKRLNEHKREVNERAKKRF